MEPILLTQSTTIQAALLYVFGFSSGILLGCGDGVIKYKQKTIFKLEWYLIPVLSYLMVFIICRIINNMINIINSIKWTITTCRTIKWINRTIIIIISIICTSYNLLTIIFIRTIYIIISISNSIITTICITISIYINMWFINRRILIGINYVCNIIIDNIITRWYINMSIRNIIPRAINRCNIYNMKWWFILAKINRLYFADYYSILVKLVDHAGISKPLISDPGPFTVFAPNNECKTFSLITNDDEYLWITSIHLDQSQCPCYKSTSSPQIFTVFIHDLPSVKSSKTYSSESSKEDILSESNVGIASSCYGLSDGSNFILPSEEIGEIVSGANVKVEGKFKPYAPLASSANVKVEAFMYDIVSEANIYSVEAICDITTLNPMDNNVV